jgi:hypothetical protein
MGGWRERVDENVGIDEDGRARGQIVKRHDDSARPFSSLSAT